METPASGATVLSNSLDGLSLSDGTRQASSSEAQSARQTASSRRTEQPEHLHRLVQQQWQQHQAEQQLLLQQQTRAHASQPSRLELVLCAHGPILEAFLLHCPTVTILQLCHTSRRLRDLFLATPTTWQYLSFRLPFPIGSPMPRAHLSPVSEADTQSPRASRPYAIDQLLESVVVPFSTCLRSLDLDNTAVFGLSLTTILILRSGTLQHLSVRGCKNVSLKYHIVPFLTMFALQYDRRTGTRVGRAMSPVKGRQLALKSLYTYRCRHHRRRPYLSDSLQKKDSDSEPTHELVTLCHTLGIWTDTAWCPTPAARCFRRQGYVAQRGATPTSEVYVVFDRLWRSRNWLGRAGPSENRGSRLRKDGRIWDTHEEGFQGEALGTGDALGLREGKTVPTHQRWTHRSFVEAIRCAQCNEMIHERCEQCSVMMHCVGCRKTLCHSCAFDRPYPRRRRGSQQTPDLWWAPDAPVSPCLMREAIGEDLRNMDDVEQTPTLCFRWCCAGPTFSGGGGITTGLPGRNTDKIRAVPLPQGQGWEDPEFTSDWVYTVSELAEGGYQFPMTENGPDHAHSMRWLLGPPGYQPSFCPRNLCDECYQSPNWKVACKNCLRPLCVAHDLRGLRLRICGFRDLTTEKWHVDNQGWATDLTLPSENDGYSETAPVPTSRLYESDSQALSRAVSDATALAYRSRSGVSLSSQSSRRTRSANDAPRASPPASTRSSRSSSPASIYEDTTEADQKDSSLWKPCHSFFCPQVREAEDRRERCDIVLLECTVCRVLVCERCQVGHPPCTCSYCQDHYTCPNCHDEKVVDGSCRLAAEETARTTCKARRTRMREHAAEMAPALVETVERERPRRTRSATRPRSAGQLGSFLFNPFFDSGDEGDQDGPDRTHTSLATFDWVRPRRDQQQDHNRFRRAAADQPDPTTPSRDL